MNNLERDPTKRQIKVMEVKNSILDFDLGEESSDDSDFRIEDHADVSDDDDFENSNDSKDDVSDSSDDVESDNTSALDELDTLSLPENNVSSVNLLSQANKLPLNENDFSQILICCGCLSDQSDGANEIVECDSCGVTVHEACYGISETCSVNSSDSLTPTAPWFCEACKAGVMEPVCELCPNSGGIFKETDAGRWIHLVCALYVPGVAFGEVDKLANVTLFEMPYNRWGAKTCFLCQDERFARTGVCIGCDAGLCKSFFHVTCAQKEGFLSEAHSEEVDHADPFYAHCKLHSDKTLVKRRKKNYLALQLRMHYRRLRTEKQLSENEDGGTALKEGLRIKRKLDRYQSQYLANKLTKATPWVPTQKMPRLLTTSASACKKLFRKAGLMGIDTILMEVQESQAAALVDVRKKWHIPPAFTVEFIAYYLDRNDRMKQMKSSLSQLIESNRNLLEEQATWKDKYEQLLKTNREHANKMTDLKDAIMKLHTVILYICPTLKNLRKVEDLIALAAPTCTVPGSQQPQQINVNGIDTVDSIPKRSTSSRRHRNITPIIHSSPTTKSGVSRSPKAKRAASTEQSIEKSQDSKFTIAMLHTCGICKGQADQHLMAICDTCHLYYHLYCLNPPLTRLPKKSKLYGWQCSECDKSSDSDMASKKIIKTTRRSTSKYKEEPKELEQDVDAEVVDVEVTPSIPASSELSKHIQSSIAENISVTPKLKIKPMIEPQDISPNNSAVVNINDSSVTSLGSSHSSKMNKKHRRDKKRSRHSPERQHHNDSNDSSREHKKKRKKMSFYVEEMPQTTHPRITIKIKPIPLPEGKVASESSPQCFYVPSDSSEESPPKQRAPPPVQAYHIPPIASNMIQKCSPIHSTSAKQKLFTTPPAGVIVCNVCKHECATTNSVRCDECQKNYHFTCLDPPIKKTPKRRGYSWHCADCDPTCSE